MKPAAISLSAHWKGPGGKYLGQTLIKNPQRNESFQQSSEWGCPSPGEFEMPATLADTLTRAYGRLRSRELS